MSDAPQNVDRKVRDAVQKVIDVLINFDDETRTRVLQPPQHFINWIRQSRTVQTEQQLMLPTGKDLGIPSFSDRQELSPKEFLFQKQPKTDVERVACLAYYLTHYRGTPHFKTVDISKLNTEAAGSNSLTLPMPSRTRVMQGS